MELTSFQIELERYLLAEVPDLSGPSAVREIRGEMESYVHFQLGDLEVFIYEDESGWSVPGRIVTLEWQDYIGKPIEKMYEDLAKVVREQLAVQNET